jgi:hypothetical protein
MGRRSMAAFRHLRENEAAGMLKKVEKRPLAREANGVAAAAPAAAAATATATATATVAVAVAVAVAEAEVAEG